MVVLKIKEHQERKGKEVNSTVHVLDEADQEETDREKINIVISQMLIVAGVSLSILSGIF